MSTYFNKMSIISLSTALVLAVSGCGGGGGDDAAPVVAAPSLNGSAGLSGTLGNAGGGGANPAPARLAPANMVDPDASAQLIVDLNKNGTFGDSKDITYTSQVIDGSFNFSGIEIEEEGVTEAQLTVLKRGFVPVVKVVTLSNGQTLSIIAEAGTTPLQTEVVALDRNNSNVSLKGAFLKMGLKTTSLGIQSYSKIMSLSQLRAEAADPDYGTGEISTSVIPLDAIPDSVTEIRADMKAFDPTSAEDSKFFPGEYKGVGKSSGAKATDEERQLVSVGFDLISLTDQNGEQIELDKSAIKQSKLRPQSIDFNSCLQTKVRYLSAAQVTLIENMGDDDNSTVDIFEIPMWYYDNQSGMWQYLGEAEYTNAATSTRGSAYATMCITENWGQYLNLDYDFAIEQPKNICIKAVDQDGGAVGNLNISAQKDTSYTQAYLDSNGEANLGLTLGSNPSDYDFAYSGALTRWMNVDVDSGDIVTGGTDLCDYNMSIVIQNPYTTTLRVTAKEINGDSSSGGYVTVSNNSGDYFYEYRYLDAEGVATFKIAQDVAYSVNYNSKEVTVTANSITVAPETSDSGNLVEVTIQDVNSAPDVYAYFNNYYMSENATQANFYVSARDPNGDTIHLVSLTLNGTPLVEGTHYEVTQRSSGDSYDSFYATLDLENEDVSGITGITRTSLTAGNYTLVATYSDSIAAAPGVGEAGLVVEANQAPIINGIYLQSETDGYLNINSEITAGTYDVSAFAYDPNGDAIVLTYQLDSNGTADTNNTVVLTDGEHTITVVATEVDGTTPLSDQDSFTVVVGDRSPSVDPFTAEVNDNDTVNGNLIPTDDFFSTVALVGTAPNGLTLYMTGAYSFDGRAHNDLADGVTREVVANLRVTNRYGTADTNLTVTVTGTNDAPTLTIAPSVIASAAGVEIPYATTDVDGIVSVSAVAVNGIVAVGDENLTYTPNTGALSDTITVTATDGDLNVTSIVIVTFGNQPPSLGYNNYFEVDGGASISGHIDFSDDGETLATVAIAQDPVPGLTINADGSLTYSAAAFAELALNATETIYVNVRVTDSEGLEVVGEISITVHGVYTAPLGDGGFTEGMSIYDFEKDEDGSVSASRTTLAPGGSMSETNWYLNVNTGEFVLDSATGGEENNEYYLLNGVWTQGWGDSTYTLVNGNVRLNNGFMVSILRTIDLVNPDAVDAAAIAALSAEIPGNPTIAFNAGAEAYVIGMKAPELYVLTYQPTLQVQNETGEWTSTETPFSTLLDFMGSVNSPAGSYSATGVWSGIDFERSTSGEAAYFHAYPVVDSTGEIISSLVAGMSGGLVVVDHSATPVTQQEVGSWSVVSLPDGAGLALELTLTTGDSSYLSNLIAVANGTVYQGIHRAETTSFEVNEEDTVGLNSIAFEDVKDAIRAYITGGSGENTLATLLAGRTFWSQIEGTTGTLESQLFNTNATGVTWTEVVNPGGSLCTGTVSLAFEANATVTVQGVTDSCGLDDPNNPFNVSVEASEGWNYILVGGDRWYYSEADARADFLGGTTPPPATSGEEAALEIRSLSVYDWDTSDNVKEWFWEKYMLDVNGSYVVDPNSGRPDNAVYGTDLTVTLNDSTAVKYLGSLDIALFNTEFGSTFSSDVAVHRVAYIKLVDEVETWEDAQDPNTNTPFTSLEGVISTYNGANGMTFENSGFPDGEGLAFGSAGVLIIVNANGETINANAGTYEIVEGTGTDSFSRALKTRPTYDGYTQAYHAVFTEEGTVVRRGDWSEADTGGIAYFFNEAGKSEYITYFNENQALMTTDFEFQQDRTTGWLADWNSLTAQDASVLDGTTLFELSVSMESTATATTTLDFGALVGKTIYFQNDNGDFGMRTFEAGGTTTGILSWSGEYTGTYTTQDNTITITSGAVDTTITFMQQPDFTNMSGVTVSINGTSQSVWNTANPMPASLMNVDITYFNDNATGVRYFTQNGLYYDAERNLVGGYFYNDVTGIVTMRDAATTTTVTLPLDLVNLTGLGINIIRDYDNALLVNGTTTWSVGGATADINILDGEKYFAVSGIPDYAETLIYNFDSTSGIMSSGYNYDDHNYSIVDSVLTLESSSETLIAESVGVGSSSATVTLKFNVEGVDRYVHLFGTTVDEQIEAVRFFYATYKNSVPHLVDMVSLVGKNLTVEGGDYPNYLRIDSATQLTYMSSRSGEEIFQANYVEDGDAIKFTSFVEGSYDSAYPPTERGYVFYSPKGSLESWNAVTIYDVTNDDNLVDHDGGSLSYVSE